MKSKRDKIKSNSRSLVPTNLSELKTMESVVQSRIRYAGALGESYGGARDLYQALGYDTAISYTKYLAYFKREDISKTLIEKLPKACWTNPPVVTDESEDSVFEKEFAVFVKKFSLYSLFFRADKLMRLGYYGVLFLGFNDAEEGLLNTEVTPGSTLELLYIQPYSDQSAKIHSLDNEPTSRRFGLPLIYQISITDTYNTLSGSEGSVAQSSRSILVHWTRVIHLIEDPLENQVLGTPYLECVFNRIQDTRKILGGSAEMFWRGGIPGKIATAKENYSMGANDKEELQTQMDEYEHNLRRFLTVQGVDITNMEMDIKSPRDALDVQMTIIAIVTGYPKRILEGSERGELASSQDHTTWNSLIRTRQVEECSPVFLQPLIDRLIEFQVLPVPKNEEYMINWPALVATGEMEKAEIAKIRIQTLKEYVSAPGADLLLPPKIFFRDEMKYTQEQIDEIESAQGQPSVLDDLDDMDDEELDVDLGDDE